MTTPFARFRRSAFAFPLAALAALTMVYISETSYTHSIAARKGLSEISTARYRVQRVLRLVLDAETAQRGYLLTGRKEYQQPFQSAIERLPRLLTALKDHYASKPRLAQRMVQLDQLITHKLSELAETMHLYEQGQHEAWRAVLLTNVGQQQMAAIRTLAEQMLDDETKDGESMRASINDTLLTNRLGVDTLTVLSLLALFMYLGKTRALDRQRLAQQRAVQAERDQLEVIAKHRTADLTELSRYLLTVREDERSRLARELHDELGALFTSAKLDTARIRMRIGSLSPEVNVRLDHLNEILNLGIALKRRIIEDLRPSSLTNLGLVAALEILVSEFAQRVTVKVEASLEPVSLTPECELTVYRLVQEALTNVTKYAKAFVVGITLAEHKGVVEIAVVDDGVGFDATAQNTLTHGLLGMRYRVEAEGGTLTVQSSPGQGTRIAATLPVAPAH